MGPLHCADLGCFLKRSFELILMIRWEDCICHLHDPVLRIQVKRVMCNFIQAASFREPSLDQQTFWGYTLTPSPMPTASLICENNRLVCTALSGDAN